MILNGSSGGTSSFKTRQECTDLTRIEGTLQTDHNCALPGMTIQGSKAVDRQIYD